MFKSFRYRIYPNKSQEEVLNRTLAICCELYNAALQERRDAWRSQQKRVGWFEQNLQLREIRQTREDVEAVNFGVLENVLRRVDLAFRSFYRRVRLAQRPGYPRFRSVRRYDCLTFRRIGNALSGNRLRLAGVGPVKIKIHRPLVGTVKTVRIRRDAGRWFAIFIVEAAAQPLPTSQNAIGIDVGIHHFAALSDGSVIDNPRFYERSQRGLRIAQRRLARRKRGSNRRRKALLMLQRMHIAIRNQRSDFHHKIARKMVNENGLIAAEDLNVKALSRMILSKQVHDAGWSQFLNFIAYKAEEAGRVFVRVDPRGTSQTCTCGASVRKTLNERRHLCLNCGLSGDRDHVSAQIVLGRAVAASGVNVGAVMPCVA